MMKKLLLLALFMMMITSVSAGPLYTDIRYDEFPGHDLNMIYFNVYNAGDEDYDDLQATIRIPQLDDVFVTDEFDLDEREHYSGTYYYELPSNVLPGDYEIFYTISNNEITTRDYRYFTVS